jgi:hypothetical protein
MTDTSRQLADIICNALIEAKLVDESSATTLKQQILSEKTKSEHWSTAIEKNMHSARTGNEDGE